MANNPNRTIANQSIFCGYKRAEDALTAALLQVMHYGGHELIARLFDGLIDLPSNEANIVSQSYQDGSNPDGEVSCNCSYTIFIESKIRPNDIRQDQLTKHCKLANPSNAKYVVYITPDEQKPQALMTLNGLVEWMTWDYVANVLSDYSDTITNEIVKFLIQQLLLLIKSVVVKGAKKQRSRKGSGAAQGKEEETTTFILPPDETVIIVGGHWGERIALQYGFYACQPNRYFCDAKYLAFYHQNRIQYLFKIVKPPVDSIDIATSADVPQDYFRTEEPNYTPQQRKLFVLKHLHTFGSAIQNDNKDKNGKPCAFIQKQTYTSYDRIMAAKVTSEL